MRIRALFCLLGGLVHIVAYGDSGEGQFASIRLTNQGKSDYVIRIRPDADATERFAAQELQRYLQQSTGARLKIVPAEGRGKSIVLGRAVGPLSEVESVSQLDAFVILTRDSDLIIAGKTSRATLYGVYTFLEDYIGCGWIQPGVDIVPRQSEVTLSKIWRMEVPAFDPRKLNLYPFIKTRVLRNIDWAAKNKLNWVNVHTNGSNLWEDLNSRRDVLPEIEKRGLLIDYGGHTFNTWVPPKRYFQPHPEYFSLVQGKRNSKQLCISNPEVAAVAAANINRFLDENPEIRWIDMWLNDAGVWCECESCRRMERGLRKSIFSVGNDKTYYSQADSNMTFVNDVARRVAAKHPNVKVEVLAFIMLLDAPSIRPDPNIVIGFAPMSRAPYKGAGEVAGYYQPIYERSNEINRAHLGEVKKWLDLVGAERFFMYEYFSLWKTAKAMINMDTKAEGLEGKLVDPAKKTFYPIVDTMAKDIWYYSKIGIKGISTEEWDWNELNMYAYPRLIWNPGRSAQQLIGEYCERAYGPASGPMLRHWLALEEGKHRWAERKKECIEYLEEALRLVRDDAARQRVFALKRIWESVQ